MAFLLMWFAFGVIAYGMEKFRLCNLLRKNDLFFSSAWDLQCWMMGVCGPLGILVTLAIDLTSWERLESLGLRYRTPRDLIVGMPEYFARRKKAGQS